MTAVIKSSLLRRRAAVCAGAGEDTDSAGFLPVLAPCLCDACRGEMGGCELGAKDRKEVAMADPPDDLVIDMG